MSDSEERIYFVSLLDESYFSITCIQHMILNLSSRLRKKDLGENIRGGWPETKLDCDLKLPVVKKTEVIITIVKIELN